MTCKKLLYKAEEQYQKYLQSLPQYSDIIYVKFIGDPTIETEYMYDKNNNLLILKCKDDYLNLPHKVYCFFKAIRQLFPGVTNVIKMDDDVKVDLPNLHNLMVRYKDVPYAGRYVCIGPLLSTWLHQKTEVCLEFCELGTIPVYLHRQQYCAGCIYFLNINSIDIIINYPQYFAPFPDDYINYLNDVNDTKFFLDLNVFEDYNVGMVLTKLNDVSIQDIRHDLITAAYWEGI